MEPTSRSVLSSCLVIILSMLVLLSMVSAIGAVLLVLNLKPGGF